MITTLDEAIQHCEEVANKQFSEGCSECGNEHLILAQWLRELKAYRIVMDATAAKLFKFQQVMQLTEPFSPDVEFKEPDRTTWSWGKLTGEHGGGHIKDNVATVYSFDSCEPQKAIQHLFASYDNHIAGKEGFPKISFQILQSEYLAGYPQYKLEVENDSKGSNTEVASPSA